MSKPSEEKPKHPNREQIDDAIAELMMQFGPDGHCDGHEQITEYVVSLLAQEKASHEWTKDKLGKEEFFHGQALLRIKTLEEENRILAINGQKREGDAFNEGYYQETISELREALEKQEAWLKDCNETAEGNMEAMDEPEFTYWNNWYSDTMKQLTMVRDALGKGEK